MKRLSGLVLAVALAAAAPVRAQDTEGSGGGDGHWSVLTGRTVGAGNNVLHPEVGWPGIGATFLHGSTSKFDIGARFGFDYGNTTVFLVTLGLRFQAVLRFTLLDTGLVSLAFYTAPGISLYPAGAFGILLPIGVQVGIHTSRLVAIALGFDLDLALVIAFQGGFGAGIPILFGPGVEFNATPDLAITFNLRLGPGIAVAGGTFVNFAFRGLIGIAVKL